ncbi:MAG: 2-isopropylmalate synthase [Candidatus Latescibacteria bacterium]|jgi:2-isopropylmalate synthase|nr:2-isopropylmalate synthase [Candidatus Latescibacterota bacterium]
MAQRKIDVFDTTLRDGEQVPGASLNRDEKLHVAHQLASLGVDIIEAGFAASSPGDFAAVKMIAESVKGPVITALARAVESDIEAVAEAVKPAERPRIHMVLGTSKQHLDHKFRKSEDDILKMGVDAVKFARNLCPEIEYSTEDASRSDFDYLCRTLEAVIDAGASVVNIPDTVGYAVPEQWGELIRRIIETVPNIHKAKVSVHCHNDLGMATANSLAAIKAGAQQVECTMNGIGERAGNASLEEIVMAVKMRGEFYGAYTDIDTRQIYPTSVLVRERMHMPVQANKAIVGANAFSHSSGIHQDGVLKNRENYEIMTPEDVGIEQNEIILTARSGRHALRHRLELVGYTFSDEKREEFDHIYARFLNVADRKKEVLDTDLHDIMKGETVEVPEQYHLVDFQAVAGIQGTPMATVRLNVGGEVVQAAANGDGPVAAAFNAIDEITKLPSEIQNTSTTSVGKHGEQNVTINVGYHDQSYTGQASATDVVEASIRAYLNSLNKFVATHSGVVGE